MKILTSCFLLIAAVLVPNPARSQAASSATLERESYERRIERRMNAWHDRMETVATSSSRDLSSLSSPSVDGTWSPMFPQLPYGHTAIFDPLRDRMLVIGATVMALPMSGMPTWTELSTTGTTPEVQTAVYDPVRDRVVIFGIDSEVWTLSLAGAPSWLELTPSGTPPPHSWGPVAIYDPVGDRMLIFTASAGVWELPLSGDPVWTELAPAGTPPTDRWGFSVVYDPVRHRAVLFGGEDVDYLGNEVWSLSLSGTPTWTELAADGTIPPFRAGHTAIYDPLHDRMVVYGGDDCNLRPQDDVWALNLSGSPAWTEVVPAGRPPQGRSGHAAFYDATRSRMVIYGGANESPRTDDLWNDTWALSLSGAPAWTPIDAPPSPRNGHTAIYDPRRDRMVVFAGSADHHLNDPRDDLPALMLSGNPRWTVLNAGASPEMWAGHTAIYDPSGDRMVVFGGWPAEVWALSLSGTPTWASLTPSGTPPSTSSGHLAIYDSLRDRMLVFDGTDVFALSLSGPAVWSGLTPSGTAPGAGDSAIYDPLRDRMLVVGGNHVWELSLSGSPAWTELNPSGTPPSPRRGHTAIYDPVRDRVVIFGGLEHHNGYDEVWTLSLAGTSTWTQLSPAGTAPRGRYGHTAIYDPRRDRMIVFGGVTGFYFEDFYDTWALEWGTPVDTAPPAIEVTLNREMLWPPNHKMVEVCATVKVLDSVDSNPTFALLGITSNEPDNGKGDGNTTNDIQGVATGTADLCYDLRAERAGGGNGREYRIIYQAKDASNNVAFDTVYVRVPKSMSGEKDASPVMALSSVHPNPFNPETTVEYSMSATERVQIVIYDVRGSLIRRLVDQSMPEGEHRAAWNGMDDAGRKASSGIYFVRMITPSYTETRKIVMLK